MLEYKRCDHCIHAFCQGNDKWACEGCPMWKTEDELPNNCEGCGCVAYNFDIDGNCPFYETVLEEHNNG